MISAIYTGSEKITENFFGPSPIPGAHSATSTTKVAFIYRIMIFFFFALQSWTLINSEVFVRTSALRINSDKVACTKQRRQTSAVNPHLDLQQSWTPTLPGNKCIFHGRHVRATRKTNSSRKWMPIKYRFAFLESERWRRLKKHFLKTTNNINCFLSFEWSVYMIQSTILYTFLVNKCHSLFWMGSIKLLLTCFYK